MRCGELLIANAVFSYLLAEERAWRLEYRFVELDRGTLPSDRLSAKLARYARLYRFRPRAQHKGAAEVPLAWQARYPVFPAVLVVFAEGPAGRLSAGSISLLGSVAPSPTSSESRRSRSPSACSRS